MIEKWLNSIQGSFARRIRDAGLFFALLYSSITSPYKAGTYMRKFFWEALSKQIYFTGVMALRQIIIISLLIGGIIIIQTINQLPKVGGETLIGTILVVVIVRELGPLIVAFIIIGRSATAITTEIASMRVSGQFDMLLTTGVNPNIYLFAPRIWGMIMSMLGLKIFFIAFAILGGFFMARAVTYINFYFLIKGFFQSLTLMDIVILNLKAFFMALSISIIAIREGIKVGIASTEIPQATTRTVVQTILIILVIDVFFAVIFYL